MKPQITVRGRSVYLGEVEVGSFRIQHGNYWTKGNDGWAYTLNLGGCGTCLGFTTEQAAQEAIIKAVQAWLKKAGLPEAEVK